MKTIPALLQQGIDNGTIATFVLITRKDGVSKGFSNHDKPLTIDIGSPINSIQYNPTPGLERITMNLRNNAEVSNQEFAGAWVVDLNETDLQNGLYDDAHITVFRADWTNVSAGTVVIFEGSLGMISWTEDGFKADVHSLMRQLGKQIGITTTAKCRHQLFNQNSDTSVGACQLNSASYTYSSDVVTVTSKLKFDINSIGQPDAWIANGILTWTSGLNNGVSYEVKSYVGGEVELFLPTTFVISPGDTFDVTAGCDKNVETCKTKFSNINNFGGFPHIKPEVNWK